jgi:hypothetical protein
VRLSESVDRAKVNRYHLTPVKTDGDLLGLLPAPETVCWIEPLKSKRSAIVPPSFSVFGMITLLIGILKVKSNGTKINAPSIIETHGADSRECPSCLLKLKHR